MSLVVRCAWNGRYQDNRKLFWYIFGNSFYIYWFMPKLIELTYCKSVNLNRSGWSGVFIKWKATPMSSWSYSMRKFCNSLMTSSQISASARRRPMQARVPKPNGSDAYGWLDVSSGWSLIQRSGMNLSALGKCFSWLQINSCNTATIVYDKPMNGHLFD